MDGLRCRWLHAPGALLALLLPTIAGASAAGSGSAHRALQETAASDAGRRLEKGRAALDGMDFSGAATLLGEAIEFYRSADLKMHRASFTEAQGLLAAAHLLAGDEAEARNTLRSLLTVDDGWDLPPERRSPELGQLIDAVRAELTSLQRAPLVVRSTPEGATVILDGLELGKTPLSTRPILPGRHVVALERAGSVPRQELVFVGPSTKLEWILVEDPEAAVAAAPKPRGFWKKHRGKVFLGTAGLGGGATALLLLQARQQATEASLVPQTDTGNYELHAARARTLNRGGNVAFYTSVGLGLLATYYLLSDGAKQKKERQLQAGVAPLPGGAAVMVGGTF